MGTRAEREMNIKPDDLVLEVGSGDKPYPRADILLDKLPEDSTEREAGRGLVIDRPLVIGDVEALPFADKSFDYIIASHVLEHAQDPAKFLSELSRVGKRGYIETPSPERERVFDWPFHRWWVYQEGEKLVLVKKTAKSQKKKIFYHFDGTNLLNLHFEWEGKVKYKVFTQEPEEFLAGLDKKLMQIQKSGVVNRQSGSGRKMYKWFKDKLFKVKVEFENIHIKRWRKKNIDLFSLIACPVCKRNLKRKEDRLICEGCSRSYCFLRDKIPQLLA